MKVTQSRKTGKFSLTQLEKSDLINLHNTLTDYTLKTSIRLALLDLMPGDERVKLQSEEAIEEYFESQGLILKTTKTNSSPSASVSNGASASSNFPSTTVQESDDNNDDEETEVEEELPL